MKCTFCGFNEVDDALFCSDCGEPFYMLYYPTLIYATHGEIKFDIVGENRGKKNLKLLSTQLENHSIANRRVSPVGPRQQQTFPQQSHWQSLEPLEKTIPHFFIEVGEGRRKIQLSQYISIFAHPEIRCEIPETWHVSSYTGFKGDIQISVVNKSAVIVQGLLLEEIPETREEAEIVESKADGDIIEENFLETYSIGGDEPSPVEPGESTTILVIKLEKMVYIGPQSQETIPFSFPHKIEHGRFRYRIKPLLYPEKSGFIEQKIPYCECQVKYLQNPGIGFALECWTSRGIAPVVYLEADEDFVVGGDDFITPNNYRKYGLNGLDNTFRYMSESVIRLHVPIGEQRIRRIKPILFKKITIDTLNVVAEFPCKITLGGDANLNGQVFFRESTPTADEETFVKQNQQFWGINKSLYLENFLSADWLELLFNLENNKEFTLTLKLSFPISRHSEIPYPQNYAINIIPYHPRVLEESVAIDFGTTNSCVAFDAGKSQGQGEWQSEGVVECLSVNYFHPKELQNPVILPTILSYNLKSVQPHQLLPFVPDPLVLIPRQICSNFKTDFVAEYHRGTPIIHSNFNKSVEAQIYDYFQILLEKIKLSLEDRQIFDTILRNLVLTVPNTFPGELRKKYTAIIERLLQNQAGLREKISLSTPQDEALAVINHALERQGLQVDDHTIIGVIDFGGGTTDITFIYVTETGVIQVATGGSMHFGGTTIDRWFFARLQRNPDKQVDNEVEHWHLTNLDAILKNIEVNELSPEIRLHLSRLKWHLNNENVLLENISKFIKDANSSHHLSISNVWEDKQIIDQHLVKPFVNKLREKIAELLNDALGRAVQREALQEREGKPRLLLFLAGNGSKLHGFPELVESALVNQFKESFRKFEVLRLTEPKEAVALGARAFLNFNIDLDRKTYGPNNAYYYKIPSIISLPNQVRLKNGSKAVPVIEEGDARNAPGDEIVKEFATEVLRISPTLSNYYLQMIEKSGIDYNELNVKITGKPPFSKIRFVLDSGGILTAEGVS
ncbi:MAG: Hsp70 family protein [Calditrichaeota bacterium]|nr:Hsp70 family protein [Calditrichota bacterium]